MSNKDFVVLKDINGNLVTVDSLEIYEALRNMTLFGMDLTAILALRKHYEMAGGMHPITSKNIDILYANKQT